MPKIIFIHSKVSILILTFFLLCMLWSCNKNIVHKSTLASTVLETNDQHDAYNIIQLSLYDIPFFVGSTIKKAEQTHDSSTIMLLEIEQSLITLVEFYSSTMLQLDWELRSSFQNDHYCMLYFEKPLRFCSLIIRQHNQALRHSMLELVHAGKILPNNTKV